MVYPGHPSTGCLQCVRRKVKCDDTRPACRRCVTRGEQCPGYGRPRYRFVASDPTRHPRGRKKREAKKETSLSDDNEFVITSSSELVKYQCPSRTWLSEVLPWYFASYTIPKEDGEAEWLNFLPAMYQESSDGSHLRMAVDAASLAAYSNYFKVDALVSVARKSYGTALIALNNALKDQNEAKLDQTLAAVLNLLVFETITAGEGPFDYHLSGLLSMLQLRGEKQFQTPRGRMLYRLVQLHLVRKAPSQNARKIRTFTDIQQTRPLMPNLQDSISSAEHDINALAARVLPRLSSENSRVTTRATLTLQINGLYVQAAALLKDTKNCPRRKSQLEDSIQQAACLDAKMEAWISSFPPALYPKEVRSHQDGSRRLTYIHHMIPIAWNMYRCGRIILQEILIRCQVRLMRDYTVPCDESRAKAIIELVRSLAEDMCDSIWFCLYEVTDNGEATVESSGRGKHAAAYLLLWPLMVVKLGSCTTEEQKIRATEALQRIGNEMGIRQACRLLSDRNELFDFGKADSSNELPI